MDTPVINSLLRRARALVRSLGFDVVRFVPPGQPKGAAACPRDFSPADVSTYDVVAPFTMCSPERIQAVCEAVRYIARNHIAGSIVECGVWKGGSAMAALRTLLEEADNGREIHLFDTFDGMTVPSERDVDLRGARADALMAQAGKDSLIWAHSPLPATKEAVLSVGYPEKAIHFVKGRVEDTIPAHAPERIALLRLDTDWYESTLHELTHLFPRLSPGGVLIVDDYGHWRGAREATDEYLREKQLPLLLTRIDYTGRMAVKK